MEILLSLDSGGNVIEGQSAAFRFVDELRNYRARVNPPRWVHLRVPANATPVDVPDPVLVVDQSRPPAYVAPLMGRPVVREDVLGDNGEAVVSISPPPSDPGTAEDVVEVPAEDATLKE